MKASDWISVKDRLPKINDRVLVCRQFEDNTFFTYIATYTGKERIKDVSHYWWYTDDGFDIDGITHWQKIVLPKKEKVMNNEQDVYVVHIETRRFWDECQNSYLPELCPVFGAYSTKEKAEREVWDYFTNRFKEQYEVCFDDFDVDGERLDYDVCFKRVDKVFGGCAFYCVTFHLATIDV